jgi:hypothetical protein
MMIRPAVAAEVPPPVHAAGKYLRYLPILSNLADVQAGAGIALK